MHDNSANLWQEPFDKSSCYIDFEAQSLNINSSILGSFFSFTMYQSHVKRIRSLKQVRKSGASFPYTNPEQMWLRFQQELAASQNIASVENHGSSKDKGAYTYIYI